MTRCLRQCAAVLAVVDLGTWLLWGILEYSLQEQEMFDMGHVDDEDTDTVDALSNGPVDYGRRPRCGPESARHRHRSIAWAIDAHLHSIGVSCSAALTWLCSFLPFPPPSVL